MRGQSDTDNDFLHTHTVCQIYPQKEPYPFLCAAVFHQDYEPISPLSYFFELYTGQLCDGFALMYRKNPCIAFFPAISILIFRPVLYADQNKNFKVGLKVLFHYCAALSYMWPWLGFVAVCLF